jgi:hypothetical protein
MQAMGRSRCRKSRGGYDGVRKELAAGVDLSIPLAISPRFSSSRIAAAARHSGLKPEVINGREFISRQE